MTRTIAHRFVLVLCFAVAAPAASAVQYTEDSSGNPTGPGIASSTENVDFADVDGDGDWDAVFADGGDDGNDQNRIWINQGGLQASVEGTFTDETAMRLPQSQDQSRDIEFADIDGDGDQDLYVANDSTITNQGARWWVDTDAAAGHFVDETAARWVGLGGPGSSLAPALVLPSGTFIDWSGDGDFGDLDNDGDLDLVHSSYGSFYSGNVPTRIFLNDGLGFFSEFNPSGTQLASTTIPDGVPALWAQGRQQQNTIDTTGQFADISCDAADHDLGDLDGDFDLDLLIGAIQFDPRLFQNLLEEQGGQLGFRDVSHAWFPADWAADGGHYEQEFGDLDGDGDLDLYGLGWGEQFRDRTFENDGSGTFTFLEDPVGASTSDAEEADYVDFDADGDLDVFIANFSGQDYLLENDGTGLLTKVQNLTPSGVSRDADAADLDGDGDYDVIAAFDNFTDNPTFLNTTQTPDLVAPYLPNVEHPGPTVAQAAPLVLRAHVYDNAPYYVAWYDETDAEVHLDGRSIGVFAARSSQGQVFRVEVPGNLVGAVEIVWSSTDEHGNVGSAAPIVFDSSTALSFSSSVGTGTPSAVTGTAPSVEALSVPFAGSTLFLCSQGAPGAAYLLGVTTDVLAVPLELPGLALVYLSGTQLLLDTGVLDPDGRALLAVPLQPGLSAGIEAYAQVFTFEGSVGGDLLASSPALALVTQ